MSKPVINGIIGVCIKFFELFSCEKARIHPRFPNASQKSDNILTPSTDTRSIGIKLRRDLRQDDIGGVRDVIFMKSRWAFGSTCRDDVHYGRCIPICESAAYEIRESRDILVVREDGFKLGTQTSYQFLNITVSRSFR